MKLASTLALAAFALIASAQTTRFAVIGDFGANSQAEADVAALAKSYNPSFFLTLGDNNYLTPGGGVGGMDTGIGQFYHDYIQFQTWPTGDSNRSAYQDLGSATVNFYPTLGNHDWDYGIQSHYNYYVLPGNERYYTVQRGNVGLFVVDSDGREPDGNTSGSIQAAWLQTAMQSSSAMWKIVTFHHPAYTTPSPSHTASTNMRWNFKGWGACAVLSGHNHFYERLSAGDLPYFVNGSGGQTLYAFLTPDPNSRFRYNADFGFMLVDAGPTQMDMRFITRSGTEMDRYTYGPGLISGTVLLQDFPLAGVAGMQVTVEVRPVGSTTPIDTQLVTLDATGYFIVSTSVPQGRYDLSVKSSHWLRQVLHDQPIGPFGMGGLNYSLVNGDVNGDNVVSLGDLGALRAAYSSVPGDANWNPNADLNGNGSVSLSDLGILRSRFSMSGDP